MKNSVTLENGFDFVSFYGGETIEGKKLEKRLQDAKILNYPLFGPFSTLREYKKVEKIEVLGVPLIRVNDADSCFCEYYSFCGYYHVSQYKRNHTSNDLVFKVYSCVTWKPNIQSIFGNYAQCSQDSYTLEQAVKSMIENGLVTPKGSI